MRCSALCVLLLAISEPLLVHAKVVVVMPKQIRRSPATPWRPSPPHYKKSTYGNNDFHRHAYHGNANRYYNKKPYRPLPYPRGGDDFDQGQESVNHVHIPYGKDVTHSVSFGKGYIPYDNIKSNNLPFVHERYAGAHARQPAISEYPSASFTSVGQEYATSATAHAYDNPHVDSFFSDMEGARAELQDNLKDSANKYYSRSIEKDLGLRNQQAFSSTVDKDVLAKGIQQLSKDVPPVVYGHTGAAGMQGAVVLPAGIPPATIGGNKDGIVLRDTVSLDEYHKKLEELTKTWPNMLSVGASTNSFAIHQPLHTVDRFSTGLPIGGYSSGNTDWLSSFAQSKQGYAVKEDQAESTNHDFRTMPIHTAPYQRLLPLGANVGVPTGVAPNVHG